MGKVTKRGQKCTCSKVQRVIDQQKLIKITAHPLKILLGHFFERWKHFELHGSYEGTEVTQESDQAFFLVRDS